MNLLDAAKEFAYEPHTNKIYQYNVNRYVEFCNEHTLSINLASLEEWLNTSIRPGTYTVRLAAVKNAMLILHKHDEDYHELINNFKKFKYRGNIEKTIEEAIISKEEISLILENSIPSVALIAEALYKTGLNISELLSIRMDSQIIETDRVKFRTNKGSLVYFNKPFYKKITEFFQSKNYLFESNGRPYNRVYITGMIKTFGDDILNKKISARTLQLSALAHVMDIDLKPIETIKIYLANTNSKKILEEYVVE